MIKRIDWRDFALSTGIAVGINAVFLFVAALVCWPLGHLALVGQLLLGYAGLWVAMVVETILLMFVEFRFRFNLHDHYVAYVATNAIISGLTLVAFVIYVALRIQSAMAGTDIAVGVGLGVLGFLASYIGHAVVTTFYKGQAYALLNLAIALVGYVLSILLLVVMPSGAG